MSAKMLNDFHFYSHIVEKNRERQPFIAVEYQYMEFRLCA